MSTVHVLLMRLGVDYNYNIAPTYNFFERLPEVSGVYGDPTYTLVMADCGAVGFDIASDMATSFQVLIKQYIKAHNLPTTFLPDTVQFATGEWGVFYYSYSDFSNTIIPRTVGRLTGSRFI